MGLTGDMRRVVQSTTVGPAETMIGLSGRVVVKAKEVAGASLECVLAWCCSLASCFAWPAVKCLPWFFFFFYYWPPCCCCSSLFPPYCCCGGHCCCCWNWGSPGLHLTALILCMWSHCFFFPNWCCCQATSTICSMLARR